MSTYHGSLKKHLWVCDYNPSLIPYCCPFSYYYSIQNFPERLDFIISQEYQAVLSLNSYTYSFCFQIPFSHPFLLIQLSSHLLSQIYTVPWNSAISMKSLANMAKLSLWEEISCPSQDNLNCIQEGVLHCLLKGREEL